MIDFERSLSDCDASIGRARRDPHVAKVVHEVDDETAQDYAIAQMAFVIGGRSVFSGEKPAQLERRRRIAQVLFLPKHLSKSGI